MSTPHRATPEQWAEQEIWFKSDSDASCFIELRDRLAAAEQRISELEGNSSAGLTGSNHPSKPDSSTPAGSLVGAVCDSWPEGTSTKAAMASLAIYAVATWLESQSVGAGRAAASWLREEAERHG